MNRKNQVATSERESSSVSASSPSDSGNPSRGITSGFPGMTRLPQAILIENDLADYARAVISELVQHYGTPFIADVRLHVASILNPEMNSFCVTESDGKSALILWQTGNVAILPKLAGLTQRFAVEESQYVKSHWAVFSHCWNELAVAARGNHVEHLFPEMFSPRNSHPTEFDLPDYKQPDITTFQLAMMTFLMGHEIGHILFDHILIHDKSSTFEGLRAVFGAMSKSDAEWSLEMLCDDIAVYACIAQCLNRWSGKIVDGGFEFAQGTNGDQWGGARNRHNFEAYIADTMIAVWYLFCFHDTLTQNLDGCPNHPPARLRQAALRTSRMADLLDPTLAGAYFSEITHYASQLAPADHCKPETSQVQLFRAVESSRAELSDIFPELHYSHWGLHPAVDSNGVVWFPGAFGGVYAKDGVPYDKLISGQVITPDGQLRPMDAKRFAKIRSIFGRRKEK